MPPKLMKLVEIFMGEFRPTVSRAIHSPVPPVPCTSAQKKPVWTERLLGAVKQQKESECVTL